MKRRIIISIVIVLLSIWSVLATITAVDNGTKKHRFFNEKASLERRLEDMDNLQAEYAELETECKEVKNKLENERYDRLAYEIITIDAADKERDFTTVFYDIARRENFSVWEELFVSQRITSIASKLSEYEK